MWFTPSLWPTLHLSTSSIISPNYPFQLGFITPSRWPSSSTRFALNPLRQHPPHFLLSSSIDDYEIVRKIGRGKYSEVFEGVMVAKDPPGSATPPRSSLFQARSEFNYVETSQDKSRRSHLKQAKSRQSEVSFLPSLSHHFVQSVVSSKSSSPSRRKRSNVRSKSSRTSVGGPTLFSSWTWFVTRRPRRPALSSSSFATLISRSVSHLRFHFFFVRHRNSPGSDHIPPIFTHLPTPGPLPYPDRLGCPVLHDGAPQGPRVRSLEWHHASRREAPQRHDRSFQEAAPPHRLGTR